MYRRIGCCVTARFAVASFYGLMLIWPGASRRVTPEALGSFHYPVRHHEILR